MIRIEAHTTITDPKNRQDPYLASIESALKVFDGVVVVDGSNLKSTREEIKAEIAELGKKYPEKRLALYTSVWDYMHKLSDGTPVWHWTQLPQHLNTGLMACQGDWAVKFDIDYFFHEKDKERIYRLLTEALPKYPTASFDKYQFIVGDKFYHKGQVQIAINKRLVGNQVMYGISQERETDMCFPIFAEKYEKFHGGKVPIGYSVGSDDELKLGIPVYNFDYSFKDQETIKKIQWEFSNAWSTYFKDRSLGDTPELAFEDFKQRTISKYKRSDRVIALEELPFAAQDLIRNMKETQLGYNCFDWCGKKEQPKVEVPQEKKEP